MKLYGWVDVWPGAKPDQCIVTGYPPTYKLPESGKRYRIEFELPDPVEIVPVDGVVSKSDVRVREEEDVNPTK